MLHGQESSHPTTALTWQSAGARRAASRPLAHCTRTARPSPPANMNGIERKRERNPFCTCHSCARRAHPSPPAAAAVVTSSMEWATGKLCCSERAVGTTRARPPPSVGGRSCHAKGTVRTWMALPGLGSHAPEECKKAGKNCHNKIRCAPGWRCPAWPQPRPA